jgi:hypothetical protein
LEYDGKLYFKEIVSDKRYIIDFDPTFFRDERRARKERIERLREFVKKKNEALSCVKKSVNEKALTRTKDMPHQLTLTRLDLTKLMVYFVIVDLIIIDLEDMIKGCPSHPTGGIDL